MDKKYKGYAELNIFPKIIYQTWSSKILPAAIQTSIDNMLRVNSNYEYRFFDDNDMLSFVEDNYDSSVLECFTSLKIGAAKADLWRYLVLYKTGGIYIDVDSFIYGKLDDIITDDGCSIISRENNPERFVQWCLMFSPKHPILNTCIESCVKNISERKTRSVLEMTGPVVYSDAVNRFFEDRKVYYKTDEQINSMKQHTGVRFHGYDYQGYAEFEHPNKKELYVNKLHWTIQQQYDV